MRRRLFGIVAALSLLLLAAVVWMWVRSFHEDRALLSWVRAGDRYTLRSHWGQLVVASPPAGAAPEADLKSVAARMSNEDFTWTSLDGGYVQGEVLEGTATWEAHARSKGDLEDPAKRAGAVRVWLRGLEEARTFAASHLMLLLAAEDRWRARWVDEAKQPWREASVAGDRLILFMTTDATGAGPDASRLREVRGRWHSLLDEGIARVFYGWIALGALALPLAWAARPRRELRTWTRWVFNGAALASVLVLVAAVAAWARSYRTSEQWMFVARSVESPAGVYGSVRAQSWIGSASGRLAISTYEAPETVGPISSTPLVAGYRSGFVHSRIGSFTPGMTAKDERRWSVPGIEYEAMPVQELTGPGPTPGTRYIAYYGYRRLVVSWWVPLVLSLVLPLIWVR
jgi:hypothetical protein